MENTLTKGTWGGVRPGAGIRAYTTKKAQTEILRSQMAKMLEPRAEELFSALIDAACGLSVEDKKNGRVYIKAPDIQAAKLLMEHTMGKPTDKVEYARPLGIAELVEQHDREWAFHS